MTARRPVGATGGGADRPAVRAATDPVLQADRLTFWYPDRPVFSLWSAGIRVGLTWLRGRNGSGKSTLLQLLGGALPPQAGRLRVRGIDAAEEPLAYRREVFWCGPGAIAFDHLRPAEYFGFLSTLYPRFDSAQALDHAAALGLGPHMGLRLAALSTGTQRKVALAAALAVGTAAVLLDEPLIALDAASLECFLERLAARAADSTSAWLVASHEPLGDAGARAALLDLDER
jgi:ABC-type multidrug transport system ATPase subunit